MARNKYLDDLGIKDYGIYQPNDSKSDKKRMKKWKKQRQKYGIDERETWNMDGLFAEWLYTHCRMYLEISIVDLTFYKFDYKGVEYTQEEAIKFILERCEYYMRHKDSWDEDGVAAIEGMREAIGMWSLIFPAMWW